MSVAQASSLNTLRYFESLCVNCGMCLDVCPHAVFEAGPEAVRLVQANDCMECGACQRNCPTGAIAVDSGVGCAAALIRAALTGGEPTCGPSEGPKGGGSAGGGGSSCCGGPEKPESTEER